MVTAFPGAQVPTPRGFLVGVDTGTLSGKLMSISLLMCEVKAHILKWTGSGAIRLEGCPVQILSTKLSTPPLRSKLVARPRLIQRLNQGLECGFVLISAPAGYGKSTLLSAWLSQIKSPSVWLSLDEGDNDSARFLTYLAAALRQIDPALGKSLELGLQTSPLPAVEILLTSTINELAQHQRPFCLVLDDYHKIQNRVVHQAVSFLLENRPAPLHLAIATRADPPLPLARLRARSQMLELRQVDLCFTTQEAADFLNHTMGLQISPEDVARITTRTEGWIAGLQMAALSMQNSDDIPGLISTLTGTNYYIFDYLLKEILARQTPEIRLFLLFTSILDQLSAPLCAALLMNDGDFVLTRPPAVILEELEHANLFVLPLDHEHRWFRYHHLFSDLTRLVLEQTYPGRSVELHRRACLWYETQGLIPAALQHAISSGDMELVTRIVSANALVLVENDEVLPTLQKIDSLPLEKFTALPWLGIARAWFVGAGKIEQSLQILAEVEKGLESIEDEIEHQRLMGYIAATRAVLYNTQNEKANFFIQTQLANELLPANDFAIRAMNLALWGRVLSVNQHDPGGVPILEDALRLARKAQKPHATMITANYLATAHIFAGNFHEIRRVCLEALEVAEEYQRRYQQPLPATAPVYSLLGRVHAEWGEFEKAIQLTRKGVMLSQRWGRVDVEMVSWGYLGRVLVYANHLEPAQQAFQQAQRIAQRISLTAWQEQALFALDSLLDSGTPDRKEISRQVSRLQESGARISAMLTARLLLRDNQPDQALVILEQALADLKGWPSFDTVRIYTLRALACHAKGDENLALTALQHALELGEPENRIMTFVREGAAMEKLLHLALVKGIAPPFVQRLLAAFEARRKQTPSPTISATSLIEPLSARELEVLELLAQGHADKHIAEILVLSRGTVHKHLENIYQKLDVHSRTEAIARGRELKLL